MVKPQPVYQVDRKTSTQRAQDLQSYLTKRVAKTRLEEMVCASYPAYKASALKASFHEAQGHAVGRCFDLSTADAVLFGCSSCDGSRRGRDIFKHRTSYVRGSSFWSFAV